MGSGKIYFSTPECESYLLIILYINNDSLRIPVNTLADWFILKNAANRQLTKVCL